jgi:glutamate formiminotransferase / formiminotetrahydrofolate cyclodeaminase
MQLIECVPNISEGRDKAIIDQIAQCVVDTNNAYLLHKDSGYDVNRTVLTIAGSPTAVCEAAFKVIAKTSELIDMRTHKGSHPRIGATDVCPLIPLANIKMSDCIELSKQLANKVGSELGIPVYLYGESAQLPERRSLANIRAGEYENLFLRIDELLFKPDFGPTVCNVRSGATAIGARNILIAFNIHLATKDLSIAKMIAQKIRERRENYQQISAPADKEVEPEQKKNIWQDIQAIGWYVKEYGCCQVSLNLLDYKKTSLHEVYMEVSRLASECGISVRGSEIIGLAPSSALLETGNFVCKNYIQSFQNITSEIDMINLAIKFLKLDSIHSFKPGEKVLEYKLEKFGLKLPKPLD